MSIRGITPAALVLALALAACGGGGDEGDSGGSSITTTTTTITAAKTVKITAAENGTTIDVAKGDKIEATVESSAGIPYTWKVTQVNDAVLEQVPGSGDVPTSDATLPGAKLAYTFVFDVVGDGSSPLTIGLVSITDATDVAQQLSVTVDAT